MSNVGALVIRIGFGGYGLGVEVVENLHWLRHAGILLAGGCGSRLW